MPRICLLACLLLLPLNLSAGDAAERAVAQVLDAFHRAAASGEFRDYFGTMTDDAVFLGTEAGERWQGQAFRDFSAPHFEQGGWRYQPERRSIQVDEARGVAWFDELLHNDKLGTCRGSGLLLKEADGWRIAQYNLSVPVPNDLVGPVAKIIQRYESLLPEATAQALPGEPVPQTGEERRNCQHRKRHKTNWRSDCPPPD